MFASLYVCFGVWRLEGYIHRASSGLEELGMDLFSRSIFGYNARNCRLSLLPLKMIDQFRPHFKRALFR